MARRVFEIMHCPDLGRVDIRLRRDGTPFFIELNPLPSLHPAASLMTAGQARGLDYRDVLRLVVRSAARRYDLAAARTAQGDRRRRPSRPTARAAGYPGRAVRSPGFTMRSPTWRGCGSDT